MLANFHHKCGITSDINEHLPVLREYGDKVDHITEMGVRGIVSTYALLASRPKKMISYDIVYVDTSHIHALAPATEYNFIVGIIVNFSFKGALTDKPIHGDRVLKLYF